MIQNFPNAIKIYHSAIAKQQSPTLASLQKPTDIKFWYLSGFVGFCIPDVWVMSGFVAVKQSATSRRRSICRLVSGPSTINKNPSTRLQALRPDPVETLDNSSRSFAQLHRARSTPNLLRARTMLLRYLANLSTGRLILWCYFIWYLVVLVRYFDPNLFLWLTSLGLSLIIGAALYISTTSGTASKVKLERWQIIRLFLMPFCVSSFAALVKGKGFILIFSPRIGEVGLAVALCAGLCLVVLLLKRVPRLIQK